MRLALHTATVQIVQLIESMLHPPSPPHHCGAPVPDPVCPCVSPSDEASVPVESDTSPFISSLSLSGSEDTLGKKLLLKLSQYLGHIHTHCLSFCPCGGLLHNA